MIYSLNGTVLHTEPNFVVIECGGVGYKCFTTMNTLRSIPKIGEKTMIYTHMIVREDAVELCGFISKDELNSFKLLTSVSGVGTKAGMAILSELKPEQLALAVSTGDSKALTKASGVGSKIAQRIILELKDKIKKLITIDTSSVSLSVSETGRGDTGNISQAIEALAVLGYSPDEVLPFMKGIDPSLSVERIIGATLKAIGRK